MEISGKQEGVRLTIDLSGRLDTTTAPELERYLGEHMTGVQDIEFDFSELAYISSAGLRVVLSTQKKMNGISGSMKIKNVNEIIMEIFEAVGFLDILTIENPS